MLSRKDILCLVVCMCVAGLLWITVEHFFALKKVTSSNTESNAQLTTVTAFNQQTQSGYPFHFNPPTNTENHNNDIQDTTQDQPNSNEEGDDFQFQPSKIDTNEEETLNPDLIDTAIELELSTDTNNKKSPFDYSNRNKEEEKDETEKTGDAIDDFIKPRYRGGQSEIKKGTLNPTKEVIDRDSYYSFLRDAFNVPSNPENSKFFLDNEYELMLKGDLDVDSFWKYLIPPPYTPTRRTDLPSIIIIGAMKCGTTSLHTLIRQHPHIAPPKGTVFDYYAKETHFFDRPDQYLNSEKYLSLWRNRGHDYIEEATPTYLFFPLVPFRVKYWYDQYTRILGVRTEYPRFIVILRDPIDRAYSHCNHWWKTCTPNFFHEQVKQGIQQIENFKKESHFNSTDPYAHFIFQQSIRSYTWNQTDFLEWSRVFHQDMYKIHKYWSAEILLRGMYSVQIRRWLNVFNMRNFYFMEMNDIEQGKVHESIDSLLNWLKLRPFLPIFTKSNIGGLYSTKSPMFHSTRKMLEDFYRPHNQDLVTLLGRTFEWITTDEEGDL